VNDIAGFVTMTMEGALLKISAAADDRELPAGVPFDVPIKIARLTKLVEPVRLELIVRKEFAGKLHAEAVTAVVGLDKVALRVTPAAKLTGSARSPCGDRASAGEISRDVRNDGDRRVLRRRAAGE